MPPFFSITPIPLALWMSVGSKGDDAALDISISPVRPGAVLWATASSDLPALLPQGARAGVRQASSGMRRHCRHR